jgi:thiol-disulfide isomerase/thioredoxin
MKSQSLLKTLFRLTLIIAIIALLVPLQNAIAKPFTKSVDDSKLNIQANLPVLSGKLQTGKIVIDFFWGEGCPHCAKAKPFLEELAKSNPDLVINSYEIYNSDENLEYFKKFASGFGFEARSVPTIFIGKLYWEGFTDEIQQQITNTIELCELGTCPETKDQLSTLTSTSPLEKEITIPLIGKIDLSTQSLFISTLLIAFVDGVNPCSIWVLSMLLAITLHTGSRKKVLLIGFIFLTVTAGVYALFIAGLFTVLKVVSFVGWIQVVVALVALFFALVNIKDYFWYKEGVSFTIDDKHKPGIYQRMRKLMDAGDSFWGLVGGTIVLAAGVSLVEFSCTAGFPVLWTNLVSAQHVSTVTFIALLLVYMFIYQIDELGLFMVAVFTLKANKMEEKHGRILKLIGGVLMLALAIVMLVKPSLMSDINQSLVIFGIAFGVTIVILLVHRVLLPKLGIRIGSEWNSKPRGKK